MSGERVAQFGVKPIFLPEHIANDDVQRDRYWGYNIIGLAGYVGYSSEVISRAFHAFPEISSRQVRRILNSESVSGISFAKLIANAQENGVICRAVGRPRRPKSRV